MHPQFTIKHRIDKAVFAVELIAFEDAVEVVSIVFGGTDMTAFIDPAIIAQCQAAANVAALKYRQAA